MIPVRLKMRNFLPYRGDIAPFSFEGIHLACITGDNGAGKTSIIDAMTWALWGKSRLRAKSTTDDDLITQGESETEVAFDFRAGDDQVYRVVRRRAKPKKAGGQGQSTLSLFLDSPEGLKTCSGNTIAETEAKIEKILHLDYETFISSAYLKQGEADHFTGLTPNQRKEVLSSILGLDMYDALAEKARDKANQAASAKNLLAASIELEQAQLEKRPALELELMAAQRQLSENQAALLEKRAALESMRAARQLYESREQSLQQAESTLKDLEADLATRRAEQTATTNRIATYHTLLANRAQVEEGYNNYLSARRDNDDLNRRSTELRRLEKQRQTLVNAITDARHGLERTLERWQAALEDLVNKSARLGSIQQSLAQLVPESDRLTARECQMDADNQTIQALKVASAAIDAEESSIKLRLLEIAEKADLLASAGDAAACPVCEAELREDRLKVVRAKYDLERVAIETRLNELAAVRNEKKSQIAALERAGTAGTSIKTERGQLMAVQCVLLKELEEAENALLRLPEGERKVAALSLQIQQGEFAEDTRKSLAAIDEEIRLLSYDVQEHDKCAGAVKALGIFESRQRQLTEAIKLLAAEEAAATRTSIAITDLETRHKQREYEVAKQRDSLLRIPRVDAGALAAVEAKVKNLGATASAASEQVGSIKQSLLHLEQLERRLSEKAAELKRHAADESAYKELYMAFGKNGIQAALIENAIPEMEAEANRLLARMTDNRMSLKIEPMRATRKGDMIDTFDIKIGDELGTRDYDLFSGGEAFRINFALRLALSRLLAHRAGAPLRTLIIDEGFGTQDASGIEKLKEAISSIRDQFECILVITHIEEFKDAFPARIEVFKTADGSDIRVSYN